MNTNVSHHGKSNGHVDRYADPDAPALPATGFVFDLTKAALVVVDPQNDFLSPKGAAWELFSASIIENDTVSNIGRLFKAAKAASITVAVSPHYYYPVDHEWHFGGPVERLMHAICMFDRKGVNTVDGLEGSGADFLDEFKPYILDGKTIVASPHKVFGPETNDLALQLRKHGISQIVLAGMAANLCIESHLRELIEQGFEVVVVRDATAGAKLPEGDGYLAAVTNFRFLANAVWTTEYALERLSVTVREAAVPA